MTNLVKQLARDETGQDLIEYGLLASTISVVAIAAFDSVGRSLTDFYSKIRLGIFGVLPGFLRHFLFRLVLATTEIQDTA